MSRTYRRRHKNKVEFRVLQFYISEKVYHSGERQLRHFFSYYRVYYNHKSKEYKRGLAQFHSDAHTNTCKEPGPSWFKNLTHERPLRRKHKNELRKVLLDNNYEPDIIARGKLDYWT